MKTCDIHFEEYDDTAGECPYCAREKLMAQSPDVRQIAGDGAAETEDASANKPTYDEVLAYLRRITAESDVAPETAVPETLTPETLTPASSEPAESVSEAPTPSEAAPKLESEPASKPEPVVEPQPAVVPLAVVEPSSFQTEADDSVVSTAELLASIEEFQRHEVPVIVIVGLRQSGKTWFQMTLKDALRRRRISSPEGWKRSENIDSTKTIGFCRFVSLGEREAERTAFVVVDVPGEQVGSLLSQRLASNQALVAAIQAASSIILTLPSDQIIFSDLVARTINRARLPIWLAAQLKKLGIEDFSAAAIEKLAADDVTMERSIGEAYEHHNSATSLTTEQQVYLAHKRFRELLESRDRLDELGVNLVFLAALLSYLRVKNLKASDIGTGLVTEEIVRNHSISKEFVPVGGRDGKDCPLFVALTKADLFLSLVARPGSTYHHLSEDLRTSLDNQILYNLMSEEQRETFCALSEDPRRLFGKCKSSILSDITSWFRLNKFDFVTTHFGYDGGNRIEIDQHQDKQFGIEAVIEWIDWARGKKRKTGLQYMGTEMARLVRTNIVDKGKRPMVFRNAK